MEFKILESNIDRKKRMINKLCYKNNDFLSNTERVSKIMNQSGQSRLSADRMNKSNENISMLDNSFKTSLFSNFSNTHTNIKQLIDQKPMKQSIEKFQRSKSRDSNHRFGNLNFTS